MKKRNLAYVIILGVLLTGFSQWPGTSTAFGLSLMGPPRSLLSEEQNSYALELGYSEMDLQTFGDVTESPIGSSYTEYKIENLKSTMITVRFDTNVSEDWDMFLRLGAADASDEITEVLADGSIGQQYEDFDGGFGTSWGIGTKTTFYQEGNTTWGGIFQVNWTNPGDSDVINASDTNFTGDVDLDFWEVQIAIGPTVTYENMRIYGGPFLHFVNGELELNGNTLYPPATPVTVDSSHDIKEESQLGGFLGAQWKLGDNSSLITEVQFTDDAWGVGIGTYWKF